jgi:hypothetical protein
MGFDRYYFLFTNWFQRLWLQIVSREYRQGLSEGLSDARFELSKNPHTSRIPTQAHCDAEIPMIKALFASSDRRWACLAG